MKRKERKNEEEGKKMKRKNRIREKKKGMIF